MQFTFFIADLTQSSNPFILIWKKLFWAYPERCFSQYAHWKNMKDFHPKLQLFAFPMAV